ncbi:MAG: hypothetical protein KGJ23_11470 [Euryarchaeota archaeon]|nr:hypothetical protein [Euryarchaeota archaeon]MDE1837214.1 hypothetical protein [Euryarchaeota archaeon]MDE1881420.1 hypothetical protein [Euryarchaeota archaeon]MDE2045370.1 hypothetical protein [Thermoplasmata archaeon]
MTDPKFVTREMRATPGIRALPSEDRTANRMKALRAAPPGGYAWKEARDHFRDLARGDSDPAPSGVGALLRGAGSSRGTPFPSVGARDGGSLAPDHLGRRLYTDAGKANSKYVARVAWRAYHAKQVPATARQWGLLEAAVRRTFEELEAWGLTATRVSRPPSTS